RPCQDRLSIANLARHGRSCTGRRPSRHGDASAMSMPSLLDPFPARRPEFRRRIVLLSHLMRVLAVVWALWNLVNVVRSLVNVSHAPSIDGAGHHGLLAAAVVLA